MRGKWHLAFIFIVLVCISLHHEEICVCSDELVITSTVTVRSGKSKTYENLTIYYDSSMGPVFDASGSLRMINCKVVPLNGPVDFIESYEGEVYLENVTVINPVFNNTAKLFHIESSDVTLIDSDFEGFRGSETWWIDDMVISNCSFNMTGQIRFEANNKLTVTGSRFDLYTNRSATFLNIRGSSRSRFYNNNITLPLETAIRLGAWLTAVDFFRTNDTVFAGNEVRNAGKVFVANGAIDVVCRDNILANDEYVNSELQVTGGSRNVLIADNVIWNLHDSIEIYDHDNITLVGNHITTNVLGFYIKPSNTSAPTEVYILNNTQIGGSVSTQVTNGLVIDGNKFIDTTPIHLRNNTNTVFTNNILENSTLLNDDSANTTIDGNVVLTEPDILWFRSRGDSSETLGTNQVHILEDYPPEITNIVFHPSNPLDNETITVRADVWDGTGIQYVMFHSSVDDRSWDSREMTQISDDAYEIEIGPYVNDTVVEFYLSAQDKSYNENIGTEDKDGEYYRLHVKVNKPTVASEPAQEPISEPEPTSQRRIPGFPLWSIIVAIGLVSLIQGHRERTHNQTNYSPYISG